MLGAIIKPHNAIFFSAVALWLKSLLEASGIDILIFSAHSVRGASSSAVAFTGISNAEILKAANWSLESVFQMFYYRSTDYPSQCSLNNQLQTTPLIWETEPSEI